MVEGAGNSRDARNCPLRLTRFARSPPPHARENARMEEKSSVSASSLVSRSDMGEVLTARQRVRRRGQRAGVGEAQRIAQEGIRMRFQANAIA